MPGSTAGGPAHNHICWEGGETRAGRSLQHEDVHKKKELFEKKQRKGPSLLLLLEEEEEEEEVGELLQVWGRRLPLSESFFFVAFCVAPQCHTQ